MSRPSTGRRTPSPSSTGRASPALRGSPVSRASRRFVDDLPKKDKTARRYATGIERALASFDATEQEWADYIAFLARLLKAIQGTSTPINALPHASAVTLRLAQCLSPTLPSGVHQKALDVYACIFSLIGRDALARDLPTYLPGLLPVLSFASLSVRPLYYAIFEEHILKIRPSQLRPALKSLILCLLPGVEDETSEDFERGFRIIESLRGIFASRDHEGEGAAVHDGYFWQCFFLAVTTSPSKRQGALSFLSRKLPVFAFPAVGAREAANGDLPPGDVEIPAAAEAALIPEPGLLIRCFAAGLQDAQILVQRGFLDLLVTHLPLHSPALQQRLDEKDRVELVSAAVNVVLRRDMGLNRRLWSWFLGSSASAADPETDHMELSSAEPKDSLGQSHASQAVYFQTYGAKSLQSCIMAMLSRQSPNPSERSRPFRICLSLMDRWEVGGFLVPHIFQPAMESAFQYSRTATDRQLDQVVRSASLFFDGVESGLIWADLIRMLKSAFDNAQDYVAASVESVAFLQFVVDRFNVQEEEMRTRHIPNTLLYLLGRLTSGAETWIWDQASTAPLDSMIKFAQSLIRLIPARAFNYSTASDNAAPEDWRAEACDDACSAVLQTYRQSEVEHTEGGLNIEARNLGEFIIQRLAELLVLSLRHEESIYQLPALTDMLVAMLAKLTGSQALKQAHLHDAFSSLLDQPTRHALEKSHYLFPVIDSMITLFIASSAPRETLSIFNMDQVSHLQPVLMEQLWAHLSPVYPKFHVEAVRLIWQLHGLSKGQDTVEAQLTTLMSDDSGDGIQETCGRFAVLWEHTMQGSSSRSEGGKGSLSRRPSGIVPAIVPGDVPKPEQVLARPMLLLLAHLDDDDSEAAEFIRNWLQDLSSLDRVFSILLTRLQHHYAEYTASRRGSVNEERLRRVSTELLFGLEFFLRHLRNSLRRASVAMWQVLDRIQPDKSDLERSSETGLQFLARTCLSVLGLPSDIRPASLHHLALEVLQLLVNSDHATELRELAIEDTLIRCLQTLLHENVGIIQTLYLECLSKALRIRVEPMIENSLTSPRQSLANHAGLVSPVERIERQSLQVANRAPPSGLLACLRSGLTASSTMLFLDHWVEFLAAILPLYADAIFTNLIPLVECFCSRIDFFFQNLKSISRSPSPVVGCSPMSSLAALLNGVELLLIHAHRRPQSEAMSKPVTNLTEPSQGFFGNMVSGVFSAEGSPSKKRKTNSRLTLILCLQDAIRTCFAIWKWTSHGTEDGQVDATSAATTSFISVKLRYRTRRMLEHLFSIEGLESLEVLLKLWTDAKFEEPQHAGPNAVYSLLHVLDGTRPQNTVPIIFNALYSRTNHEALDPIRRSSLTCDLSAAEIVAFLIGYMQTIEDDAMDEIWTDCTTFLRDVLANPLPHRQILPSLLEFSVLLAEKIDNTNVGDLRKMRREIGDIFLRLLTATFTTRPSASIFEVPSSGSPLQAQGNSGATNGNSAGKNDLISSLVAIVPRLTTVLESNDRVSNATTTITNSVTGPAVHAKTFPDSMSAGHLRLLLAIAVQSPGAKLWKKDVGDAFNNARLLSCSAASLQHDWFPILRRWSLGDKDRLPELFSRLTAPTTAGIVFGVGANAARLEADQRTQLNLRRSALLLLACDQDAFMSHVDLVKQKLSDLCLATSSSSPSSVIRAEVFMVCRALILSTSAVHLSAFWPILNAELQAALISTMPGSRNQETYNNLSLMQACKLLDVLVTLSPDDFQLHEWLYITDTIDAIYRPDDWHPTALVDEAAEALAAESAAEQTLPATPKVSASQFGAGLRRPLLQSAGVDGADMKAMGRDEFIRNTLQPFYSQLSMHAYEATYDLAVADLDACRRDLLEDVLDEGTMV